GQQHSNWPQLTF
nr:immunoglobulin light chain junction region [Macaca mulatta]